MTLAPVCVGVFPPQGRGALMRGKFVLAKHGQIYEAAGLPGTALTTDINTRALRGGCITWGNRDGNPNMLASEEELSQAARAKRCSRARRRGFFSSVAFRRRDVKRAVAQSRLLSQP